MKIGLIVYGSLMTQSGGYLYDRKLAGCLKDRGHRVTVCNLPARSYGRRFSDNLSTRLKRFILRRDLDVVLQDELCHPSLFFLNPRTAGQRRPLQVAIVHHLLSQEPRSRWLNRLAQAVERRYLASVDGLIVNSVTTLHTVQELRPLNTPHVVALPGGDHLTRLPSRAAIEARVQGHGPLKLIFLGSLIPRKGLLPLIQDLDAIDHDKWHLTVLGSLAVDPGYVAKIRQTVRKKGLGRRIDLVGRCPDQALAAILTQGHLFTMPYAYEGFGIALLEAMGFGLPVIGSTRGAAQEMIRSGVNGYLVGPGNGCALGPMIDELFFDRRRLLRMSLAARQHFERHPTWSQSMARAEGFLVELVKRWHK